MKYRYLITALLIFFISGSVFMVLRDYLPRTPGNNVTTLDDRKDSPRPAQKAGARADNSARKDQIEAYDGPRLAPVDEADQNPDFRQFRDRLITAVNKQDVGFLKQHVHANIKYSFGATDGMTGFLEFWQLDADPEKSEIWTELGKVLALGGAFYNQEKSSFIAPYVFSRFPDEYDAFLHVAAVTDNVDVYAEPDESSSVITRLNHNIVKVYPGETQEFAGQTSHEETKWTKIELPSGYGFVNAEYVRSPIDYRAMFTNKDGVWKMTFFVAGD
jgi:hypothetical protein